MAPETVNQGEWGCETDDLYMIHALFRSAFGQAEEMVRKTGPLDAKRVLLVTEHLKETLETLHNHHHHEDNLYWDLIKLRAPEASADVNRMVRHHEQIARMIEEMRGALETWQENPSEKEPLLLALQEFKHAVFNHLEDEEMTVKPVASRVLTQQEWNKARTSGLKELNFKRILYQIGYMLRCAPTEALRREFWDALPGFVKLLYRRFGEKKFESEWGELYGKA
mgnify:CR=1 FL=1